MMRGDLLQITPAGLYCPPGDFYIDPWRPVSHAVITHAHADHARPGSRRYLTSAAGLHLLRGRLGASSEYVTLRWGESLSRHGVRISLHPAGHVLGSAQVRVQWQGEVWVVSGDYKLEADPTCAGFEPVRCDTFISEATFGLPIYRWPAAEDVFGAMNRWWLENAQAGRVSLLFAYSLGKAQRLLQGVDPAIGPIYSHGAVQIVNRRYRETGVELPDTKHAGQIQSAREAAGALVIAPPSAQGSPWVRRFGRYASAFASGWMLVRGTRRRRTVDRGFVISDHADWPGLHWAIKASGAERILVTHGSTSAMACWLRQQGWEASPLETRFTGEPEEADEDNAAKLPAIEMAEAQADGTSDKL